MFKLSGYLQWPIWRGLRPIRRFLVSVWAPQKPFFGGGVRWWGKNGQFLKIIIFSIFAYNSAKKCAILDHNTILETSGHILVSFEPKNGKKWPKISTPRRRSQKPKIWPTTRWHVHLFYTRQKCGQKLRILSEYPYVNFWVLVVLDFNIWGGQKSKKLEKKQKNGKKWQFSTTPLIASFYPSRTFWEALRGLNLASLSKVDRFRHLKHWKRLKNSWDIDFFGTKKKYDISFCHFFTIA